MQSNEPGENPYDWRGLRIRSPVHVLEHKHFPRFNTHQLIMKVTETWYI